MQVQELSLESLRKLILQPAASSKLKLPLLKLATFGDELSANSSLRYDANVKAIHGIEADYDGEKVSFDEALERLRKARLQSLLYTSPSHTAAKPRWRIILPSSKALLPSQRRHLVARINGIFDGQLASESFVLSQSYFYGSTGAEHRAECVSGDFIDLRFDLDERAIFPSENTVVHESSNELLAYDPQIIEYALQIIPNDDLPWIKWNDLGMAIHAAFGGSEQGRKAWTEWSKKSSKYISKSCTERWIHWNRSPPSKAGAGKVLHEASQAFGGHDWKDIYYKEQDESAAKLVLLNGHKKPNGRVEQPKEELLWVYASDVVPRAQEWLWYGHLGKGVLELITGIPGLGKSQVQDSLVACVTAGLSWPDGSPPCLPAKVVMLTAEDSIDRTVVPRLIAAGAKRENIIILKMIRVDKKKRHFLLAEDLEKMEKLAQEIGGVALITIDPITAYMGSKMDSHKATEVRSQLNPLQEFADRTGIAVSAVTHPAKNVISQKALDFFIGSQAFIAAGRIGHVCIPEYKENEEGESIKTGAVLFTHAKHSLSETMPTLAYSIEKIRIPDDTVSGLPIIVTKVVWTGEIIDITADEAVAASINQDAPVAKRSRDQDRLQNLLIELLKNEPRPVKECENAATGAGFTEKQIRKAREKLGIGTTKEGGVWMWCLPLDEHERGDR
jgi:hypothetical protein